MILDTAGPLHNLHYLNELGSPRSPNQRKFSEAVLVQRILYFALGQRSVYISAVYLFHKRILTESLMRRKALVVVTAG